LFAIVMLVAGISGVLVLVWLVATRSGIVSPTTGGAAALLVGGALIGTVGALLIFRGIVRRVGIPLRDVMDAADRVAEGDYSVRVSGFGPPPIAGLARAFNTMAERLEQHDRQRRELMADVAHELRTPLTVLQGKLEGLLDNVYPRDDGQLTELLEEAHVMSRLIEDLRTLALSDAGALKLQKEPTDLCALARDAVRSLAAEAATRGVALDAECSSDEHQLTVDPVRIREVLTNLLSNALRHTPAGGSVLVRVAAVADGGVQLEVRDTGAGMTPGEVERVFERFHKGSQSRGAGLGLSIARSLVVAHGGDIRATSAVGSGTTMTVTLSRDEHAAD
jgi:two-component system OmpR family sensor kinase/two-component system sensor histidine kinase BaeS